MKYLPFFLFLFVMVSCNNEEDIQLSNNIVEGDIADLFEASLLTDKWIESDIIAVNLMSNAKLPKSKSLTLMGKLQKEKGVFDLSINDVAVVNTTRDGRAPNQYTYSTVLQPDDLNDFSTETLTAEIKNDQNNIVFQLPELPLMNLVPTGSFSTDQDLKINWTFENRNELLRNDEQVRGAIKITYIGSSNRLVDETLPEGIINYWEEVDINQMSATIPQSKLERFPKGGKVNITLATGQYAEDTNNEVLLTTSVVNNDFHVKVE